MKRNVSHRREKILEALRKTKMHPTAEWVYEQVKGTIPDLSLGTVYRNLRILGEEGLLRVIHSDEGKDHFDGDINPHHHLLCEECGRVFDYFSEANVNLIEDIEKNTGFIVKRDGLKLSGVCCECHKEHKNNKHLK